MACKVRAELEAAFVKLDANGDGFVTASELQNFMKTLDAYKSLSKEKVQEASAKLIRMADKNSDGKISKEEFLNANADLLKQLK
ncbi:hypothetical protein HELRODRAFT_185720 [Helobdella robusta]|uniref:EF-hand domain-containing protein n=1 Tax=Helobdella robusta TaxID=6412 RepID=T1FN71_HELRO|nr:hypothetical protein HELRODRAFT_185720 [Helobdella robusta]ESO01454.1 hypothetical protein HELRODRAFT_185720 [Helobdella robusta]